jgi:hypothetical protein
MEIRNPFKSLCNDIINKGKIEADYYAMFDHTLLHEVAYPADFKFY